MCAALRALQVLKADRRKKDVVQAGDRIKSIPCYHATILLFMRRCPPRKTVAQVALAATTREGDAGAVSLYE